MKITTSNLSIYTQDHPDITVSNIIENSISLQLVIDTGFLYFQIFNRLLRSFNLPVGGKIVITGRTNNKNSTQSLVNWIVSLMVSCQTVTEAIITTILSLNSLSTQFSSQTFITGFSKSEISTQSLVSWIVS